MALFDELNIAGVKKHVAKLYSRAKQIMYKEYLLLAKNIYAEVFEEAQSYGFDGEFEELDEGWIKDYFDEYNPVTKYVFSNELDRKESRLFESIVATDKNQVSNYNTALNLLKRQVKQYAIDVEDIAKKTAFIDCDVKKVKWNAEHDHRTCGVCDELDGQIFDIDEVPDKQHYNCRCYITMEN